ncbi:MAG: cation transporter [Gemmatimonadota bacterium]
MSCGTQLPGPGKDLINEQLTLRTEGNSQIMTATPVSVVRRGLRLVYATIVYNSLEGVIALTAGLMAGSIALVGFGADSFIELTAGAAAIWRLKAHFNAERRERAERSTLRIVGISFLTLAAYLTYDAIRSLASGGRPDESVVGIAIATVSLIVMPLIARAKRRVAVSMGSGALAAEAQQTTICFYLSAILLGGLVLNATLGWWWADPLAGLAMVPLIAREGIEGVRGRSTCEGCCP